MFKSIAAAIFSLVVFSANAQTPPDYFYKGEVLNHNLTFCIKKEDAIEILVAEKDKGFEAARDVYMAIDECNEVPVMGMIVGNVVFSVDVLRNKKAFSVKVVEILENDSGKVVAYFITSWNYFSKYQGDIRNAMPMGRLF